ncbi:MAG: hypothetical protein NTX14_03130 [Candidatus Nealsonbacteria bacterium]|nr:hypothetical protein [Candidatus Nealsonbacteria bacterium]
MSSFINFVLVFLIVFGTSQAGMAYRPADQPVASPMVLNDGPYDRQQTCDRQAGHGTYFLTLRSVDGETYMALDTISVIEGNAPDYKSGGDWYFQLIDEQQRVLEEEHFQYTGLICSDSIGPNGEWTGGCTPGDTPLTLEIPYNPLGADITVYDNTGTVRFGPYNVRGM